MSIYAPYNFVPLSGWIFKPSWSQQVSHDLPFSDGISGTLKLTIKAHTPILVGGKQKKATEDQPGEVCFYQLHDGRYAIPGSSLKGMIRNVLEIASFGKMRLVEDQWLSVRDLTKGGGFYRQRLTKPVGQDTHRPLACAGWLRLEQTDAGLHWKLTPCKYARVEHDALIAWGTIRSITTPGGIKDKQNAVQKYSLWGATNLSVTFDLESSKRWPHGRGNKPLYLEYAKAKPTLGTGSYNGILVFTGQPAEKTTDKNNSIKHLEFIFYDEAHAEIQIDDNIIRAFQAIHADSDEWKYWNGKLRQGDRIPVFYLESGSRVTSLGLAMMYRLPYRYPIGQTIDHTNPEHRRGDFFDLPELLFGTVNEENADYSLKSRVSFSMAYLESKPNVLNQLPRTILSSPKASYYPSYVSQEAFPQSANRQAYITYMDATAEVRGWKRYPVKSYWNVPPADRKLKNKVKVQLYPLDKDASFVGYVDIHNLRPAELGALVWAITWGGNTELRHNLGMGKPFGLGQVSIGIDAKSWENLHAVNPAGTVPDKQSCLTRFIDMMKQAYQTAQNTTSVKWMESPQLQQLLAMANSQNALRPAWKDHLVYMELKQFQQEKNDNSHPVLPDYVEYHGSSDQHLFRRLSEKERLEIESQTKRNEEAVKLKAKIDKELSGLNPLEKKIRQELFYDSNAEEKANGWLAKMDVEKEQNAQIIARVLREFYCKIEKWKGGSKKQKQKIERIKKLLGE